MNRHELDIYVELYRRKEFKHVPIGQDLVTKDYYYLTEKQLKAMEYLTDSTTSFVGYGGSARSGKSLLESFYTIMNCLAYPGTIWGVGRKELKTLRKTVGRTIFTLLDFYGIKDTDYRYNQEDYIIYFKNKSEILFIDTIYQPSDELFTRFGGLELTGCCVDESNESVYEAISVLFSRCGWKNNEKYGLKKKLLETFNPDKNHVYSRYFVPWRDGVEVENRRFIPALPSDNPHPAVQEWIKDMIKEGDKILIERLVNGNFDYDDDPSALCDYDAILDLFENTHVKKLPMKRISADLAMQGRDRFIVGLWEGLCVKIVIDKKKSTGKEIETDLRELKDKEMVANSSIVADSDGLGNYLESYIRNIKTFHGGVIALHSKEFGNLKDECGFKLAEMINKRMIHIICTDVQKESIKKEISMCLKRDNVDIEKKKLIKKDLMKEKLGHSPDYLDCLIMGMIFQIYERRMNL
jgi:phage terminase large subunit